MSGLSIEEMRKNYVRLCLHHGLGLHERPGAVVKIAYEPPNIELAHLAAEMAYREFGATHVALDVRDPWESFFQLAHAPDRHWKLYFPVWKRVHIESTIDRRDCFLGFRGQSEPDLLESLDPELRAAWNGKVRTESLRWLEEGINRNQNPWCLASPATPGWARKVFPEYSPDVALELLELEVYKLVFAYQEDCIEQQATFDRKLHQRRNKLNRLKIRRLRFRGGDTDLTVGLSKKARWLAGSKTDVLGIVFTANFPTFEVFTTPDWRTASGEVHATMPVMVHGADVEDAQFTFRDGEIVKVNAKTNKDALKGLIASDAGASRMGEIALVDRTSPVAHLGRSWHSIHYDENQGIHFAVGAAYKTALRGGPKMGDDELDRLGRNVSKEHQDFPFLTDDMKVDAVTYDGKRVAIMRDGYWTDRFR